VLIVVHKIPTERTQIFSCAAIKKTRGPKTKNSRCGTITVAPAILASIKKGMLMISSINHFYRGKNVLITGGSSGIGLALAKQLANKGANVCILARHVEQLQKAHLEIQAHCVEASQQITYISADLTDFERLSVILNDFFTRNPSPDVLINSAGAAHPGDFKDLDLQIFHWLMNINYFGTVNITKLIFHKMIDRGEGIIVNISSMAGFLGVYGYTAYSGSKFAVRGFSDALRAELKPYNVQVSIVFPPDTKTPQLEYENQFKPDITRELSNTAGIMQPEDVAHQILKQVARGKYIITPGLEATIMFHLSNIFGPLVYPIMDRMIMSAKDKINRKTIPD